MVFPIVILILYHKVGSVLLALQLSILFIFGFSLLTENSIYVKELKGERDISLIKIFGFPVAM